MDARTTDSGPSVRRLLRRANAAYDAERWQTAAGLYQQVASAAEPDHWVDTRVSSCLYELRMYSDALDWASKAIALAPSCPLALWHYAGALAGNNEPERAASVFRALIDRGWRRVGEGQCGEGEDWAKALLNDSRFRLAQMKAVVGELETAIRWGRLHLRLRDQQKIESIYPRAESVRFINECVERHAKGC